MYQTISKLSQKINGFLDRTNYVFEVFKWSVDALRGIAKILASYPRPSDFVTVEKKEPNENSAGVHDGNATEIDPEQVLRAS
jgi:hypothetical protein